MTNFFMIGNLLLNQKKKSITNSFTNINIDYIFYSLILCDLFTNINIDYIFYSLILLNIYHFYFSGRDNIIIYVKLN